jgi:hypothetical protein
MEWVHLGWDTAKAGVWGCGSSLDIYSWCYWHSADGDWRQDLTAKKTDSSNTTISYICTYAKPHLSFPLQSGLTTFRMYYQDLCWVECCHTTTFWPSNIIPPGFNFSRPFFRENLFSAEFFLQVLMKTVRKVIFRGKQLNEKQTTEGIS